MPAKQFPFRKLNTDTVACTSVLESGKGDESPGYADRFISYLIFHSKSCTQYLKSTSNFQPLLSIFCL